LFGAEAETALAFVAGPMTVEVPFKHSISYMPLLSATALAEVRTEVVAPPTFKPFVDRIFGGVAPLSGVTVLNFDGSAVTQFQSPPFSIKDAGANVAWQGIGGSFTTQGPHLVINAVAPGLKGESPVLNAALKNLAIDADVTQAADTLWLGASSVGIGKLEVGGALVPVFTGEGLRIRSETADQAPGLLSSRVAMDLKRLVVQDKTFTNMSFELQAKNLDRAVFAKLSKTMEGLKPGPASQAEATKAFTSSVPLLLKRSPSLSVKRLGAVTPWGDFKSSVDVTFDGKGELPAEPMLWVSRVGIDAKLDASASFLRWMLEEQARNRVQVANTGESPMAPAQAQQLATDLATVRLSRLEQAGALVLAGERYTVEVKVANGAITINGKPVNDVAALVE
jgi:uncharacterized protein YdgA (DUF945 family)